MKGWKEFGEFLKTNISPVYPKLDLATRQRADQGQLIADFLIKLMNLPLSFFDARMTGDLLQRIGGHRRIESFLTQSTLSVILSAFLYVVWIAFFLKRRKEIDHQAFQQLSDNQNTLIEIIQGMPEIKLQGSQIKRRWSWAAIQARLFRVQIQRP